MLDNRPINDPIIDHMSGDVTGNSNPHINQKLYPYKPFKFH